MYWVVDGRGRCALTCPQPLQLLRLLRDQGALSRAELADRLEVPRPRLLAELDGLVGLGYIAEAGPAASRGGRRSTLVELNPGCGSPPSTWAPARSTSRSPTGGWNRSRPTASRPTSGPVPR